MKCVMYPCKTKQIISIMVGGEFNFREVNMWINWYTENMKVQIQHFKYVNHIQLFFSIIKTHFSIIFPYICDHMV